MAHWKNLTSMFQPGWRSSDPAVRRKAAISLSAHDPDRSEALELLIQDNSPEVREVAIKRIDDLDLLRAYLHGEADARVRSAASVRYRQLLVGDSNAATVERELNLCGEPTVASHIAQKARDPAARRAAIHRLQDPSLLAEIALHDPEESNRLLATQLMDDAATAEYQPAAVGTALAGQASPSNSTDRNGASAHVAEPQQGPAQVRRKPSTQPASANVPEALCRAMEGLASISCLPSLQRKRRELTARWCSVQPAPATDLQRRFRQAAVKALTKPICTNSEANRLRRDLEEMIEEFNLPKGEPSSQRIVATQRNMSQLHGEDLDSARAWITLQRLYRQLPRCGTSQLVPHQSHNRPSSINIFALNRYLKAAEAALDRKDLAKLHHNIRVALAIAQETQQLTD